MIFDLGDRREGNLDDLSIRDLNLYAGCREGLSGFHATNCPAHTPAVGCNDLDVIFAIKWLQGCERFGYLQGKFPPRFGILPFTRPEVYRSLTDATGKVDLAYRNLPVYSLNNAENR